MAGSVGARKPSVGVSLSSRSCNRSYKSKYAKHGISALSGGQLQRIMARMWSRLPICAQNSLGPLGIVDRRALGGGSTTRQIGEQDRSSRCSINHTSSISGHPMPCRDQLDPGSAATPRQRASRHWACSPITAVAMLGPTSRRILAAGTIALSPTAIGAATVWLCLPENGFAVTTPPLPQSSMATVAAMPARPMAFGSMVAAAMRWGR
mmetsp:Transcript_100438/g.283284  ORF Transcript_100438/g.283284 Transcript_100438/m.283284 type:complete len:208 (+) Transcript_100438:337-960(+)